jgi:hypothetical protein
MNHVQVDRCLELDDDALRNYEIDTLSWNWNAVVRDRDWFLALKADTAR